MRRHAVTDTLTPGRQSCPGAAVRACVVLAATALAAASPFAVAGCRGSDVTPANYERVTSGMTLSEVRQILGPGELVSGAAVSLGTFEGATSVYQWRGREITITITFVNDRVRFKTATGNTERR